MDLLRPDQTVNRCSLPFRPSLTNSKNIYFRDVQNRHSPALQPHRKLTCLLWRGKRKTCTHRIFGGTGPQDLLWIEGPRGRKLCVFFVVQIRFSRGFRTSASSARCLTTSHVLKTLCATLDLCSSSRPAAYRTEHRHGVRWIGITKHYLSGSISRSIGQELSSLARFGYKKDKRKVASDWSVNNRSTQP